MQQRQADISFTARASSQVVLSSSVQIYILYNPNEKRIYFLSSISALYLDLISKIQTSYKNSQRNLYTHYSDSLMANILPIWFIVSSLVFISHMNMWARVCARVWTTHTHTHKGMIIPITLKYLVYILRTKTFFTKQYYSYPHNIYILLNKTHIFQSMNSNSPSVQFSLLPLNCIQLLACFFSLL